MRKEIAPPASLTEIQTWFASIITRPFRETGVLELPEYDDATVSEIAERIPGTSSLRPDQRVGIYNQQYWWRLYRLLQDYYPTLLRVFGYRDFNRKIAEPFFLCHPPADWFLPHIALPLPSWLRETYTHGDRPLVLQIADVDEAYERLFNAPSFPPIGSVTLALDYPIYLQPTAEIFALDADFFSFRAEMIKEEPLFWEQNDFPDLANAKSQYFFLLYRLQGGFEFKELSEAQYLLLRAFKTGATVEQACTALEQRPSLAEESMSLIAGWFREWSDLNLLAREK